MTDAGDPACGLLDAELALDRIDAELAAELPAHVRAFAAAYAAGESEPPAPAVMRRPAALAAVRRALPHALLADRALALLRLLAPLAIEDDPGVRTARSPAITWAGYAVLRAARDVATRSRFGLDLVGLVHRLHGTSYVEAGAIATTEAESEEVDGWLSPCAQLDPDAVWRELAARHAARGTCTIVPAAARPRAFVVEPGREVIVVTPPVIATPAARFALLHELGHAVATLVTRSALPRVVDEAAAAVIARSLEQPGPWFTPAAARAREARRRLAIELAAIEQGSGARLGARPPWALWHDAGAQAAYVAAETLADRWVIEIAAGPHALPTLLAGEHARIDRATVL